MLSLRGDEVRQNGLAIAGEHQFEAKGEISGQWGRCFNAHRGFVVEGDVVQTVGHLHLQVKAQSLHHLIHHDGGAQSEHLVVDVRRRLHNP